MGAADTIEYTLVHAILAHAEADQNLIILSDDGRVIVDPATAAGIGEHRAAYNANVLHLFAEGFLVRGLVGEPNGWPLVLSDVGAAIVNRKAAVPHTVVAR